MSPLDAKLLRDIWRIKGQAIAIALVIGVGVAMLVMMTGLVNSLEETRKAYYERYRLAEMFAPVARAPERMISRIASLPGVASAEGRINAAALVDLDGRELPVRAQTVSLPVRDRASLNNVHLTDGLMPDPDRADEILLLKGFADAHDLEPGDSLKLTMNGARRSFRIAGLAQSPEFLYTAAPGEFISDDSRFGVVWLNRSALAAAHDLEGAFNEALITLQRDANEQAVIDAVDRLLDPYGGLGAFGLADLLSNRFVTEEIGGLRTSSTTVPPIFLAVAAFLLYIVISRMVQSEREEIGLMKAFGYSSIEVGWHYFKFILAIAAGGALIGCLLGIAAGRAMIDLYLLYFKFPFLIFELDPASFVTGIAVSIAAASAGGVVVLSRVFSLTPASAMRPPAPADYTRAGAFGRSLMKYLDQPSRMVFRRLVRQPGRMAGAITGIACGMALSAAMTSLLAGYDYMMDLSFTVTDRSDLNVTFVSPAPWRTLHGLLRMDGVQEVEPVRIVPAVLHNGLRNYRGAINGLVEEPRLNRAVDAQAEPLHIRRDGLILSPGLAGTLNVTPGTMITMEIREGRQPVVQVPVAAISENLFGSPAYMEIGALNRLLREPLRISGAYLRIDTDQSAQIYRKLKEMPAVAGVSVKAEARDSLQRLLDEGAGFQRYVMLVIAGVITFGIVYNSARIAQAERSRDLASLRVIGFTRNEVAFVLLGELAVIILVALPIGSVLGYYLGFLIAEGFSTDLYQIPVMFSPASHGIAAVAVIVSALFSGWLVKRDIDRTDLISALKTRE